MEEGRQGERGRVSDRAGHARVRAAASESVAAPACLAMAVWAGQRPFEPLFFHALGLSSN